MVKRRRVHLSQFHQTRRLIVCHIITITGGKKKRRKTNGRNDRMSIERPWSDCDCDSMKRNVRCYIALSSTKIKVNVSFVGNGLIAMNTQYYRIHLLASYTIHALTAQTNASRTETICCHSFGGCLLSTQSQSNLQRMYVCFSVYATDNGDTEPICSRSKHFRFVFCLFVCGNCCMSRNVVCTSSELTMWIVAIFKTWQIRDFPILLGALNALCLCVCY